LVPVKSGE